MLETLPENLMQIDLKKKLTSMLTEANELEDRLKTESILK